MATSKVMNALVGASNRGKFPAIQGSQLSVNMYYSKSGNEEYMESLPGLRRLQSIAGMPACRGSYVSTIGLSSQNEREAMFVVFGTRVYKVAQNGTLGAIGMVASGTDKVSFAETGGPRALLLIADGTNLYYYDLLEGGTLHQIQLPERITARGGYISPTHVAVVGGSIVVNDAGSGYCYYSKAYPLAGDTREMFVMDGDKPVYDDDGVTVLKKTVESWRVVFEDDYGVPQYFNTESSSDNINGLVSVGGSLYVFGPKTVEIWQRGTGEYESWIRTSYTAQDSFGLDSPNTLASVGSVVYFVTSGSKYGKAVMKASGTSYEKISDDWLESKLLEEETGMFEAFAYSVGEHNFYCLRIPTLGETWCYDTLDGGWHKRESMAANGMSAAWRCTAIQYFADKFYAFTDDGVVCRIYDDYWKEDFHVESGRPSANVVRSRQTGVIVNDLRTFIIEELAIECNVGNYPAGANPSVSLRVSRDGGVTFTDPKTAHLGLGGHYAHRVRWRNLGMNRKCVIRVSFSEPYDFVLKSCAIRAETTAEVI